METRKYLYPRWNAINYLKIPEYLISDKWTYLYDHSPLIKTLENYIDYNRIKTEWKS